MHVQPHCIVKVLKDASASAINGARGANSDISVPERLRKPALLNTEEWLAVEQKIYELQIHNSEIRNNKNLGTNNFGY